LSPLAPGLPTSLPSPPLRVTGMSPIRGSLSPTLSSMNSPAPTKTCLTPTRGRRSSLVTPATASTPTTAQDVLNNLMGRTAAGGDASRVHHRQMSSAPQPQLLFGSGPPNDPGHSIWSTFLDDDSLKFQGVATSPSAHIHHTPTKAASATTTANDLSPPIWSSSFPNVAQNAQSPLVGVSPLSYSGVSQPIGHQRRSSAQASLSSPLLAQQVQQGQRFSQDALVYSASPHASQHPAVGQHSCQNIYDDPAIMSNSAARMSYPSHFHHYHHDPRVAPTYASPPLWGSTG
jgi:protein SMG7